MSTITLSPVYGRSDFTSSELLYLMTWRALERLEVDIAPDLPEIADEVAFIGFGHTGPVWTLHRADKSSVWSGWRRTGLWMCGPFRKRAHGSVRNSKPAADQGGEPWGVTDV